MEEKEELKKIVLSCLEHERGNWSDNYNRASATFRGCTEKQMKQTYCTYETSDGPVSKTKQQVLDGYKTGLEQTEKAIEWIKRL